MTRFARLALSAFALGVALALAAPASPAGADAHVLPDSTVLDISRLANGMRVVVRHVPRASHVAITLAWPVGTDSDPEGQTGHASLLAEVLMTAEAGDTPERSREELDRLRPAGWGAGVSPRVTQVTEIVTRAQFPGALHQTAQRLRGVTVSDSVLARAIANLQSALRAQRHPTSNTELYLAAREVALGGYDPGEAEAGLRALAKLKAPEVEARIRRSFVPGGTVLSLAGNVGEMNLAALVENEFGGLPSGERPPDPPARTLRAGSLDLKRPGLSQPAGVLGILAPALEDSLHPSFYLATLFLGGFSQKQWAHVPGPLGTRFQYSLFDEPEIARFYPPVGPGGAADSALDHAFNEVVSRMGAMVFPPESYDAVLRGVAWLLGAPMPPEVATRARRDPKILATLASNQAVRELWGGEPFWNEYRRQISPMRIREFFNWVSYLLDRSKKVKLLLHPAR